MRAFVGIPLPNSFRLWMHAFETAAKHLDLAVRTVPAETCHMTLCFLGDIEPGCVDALADPLKTAVAGSRVLDVSLDTLGVFRHGESPSVLWGGCSRENRGASDLAAAVENACSGVVKRSRERFRLHVTVARFMSRAPNADMHTISRAFPGPYSFLATEVVLFESILGLGVPEYHPLLSLPLPQLPNRETALY